MNDKDNTTSREQYGRKLAAHLCDQHFGARPTTTLDGPAVLRFTPIRQVNLFVVQQLLAQWTQEMARLRSPYFDFEADDVRTALTQFMNVLSRRIKLGRGAFEPLLARAVSDALAAAQNPAGTFDEKLLNKQPNTTAAALRDALRYVDVNKPLYQGFLDTLPTDATVERDALLRQFRQYLAANAALQQPLGALVAEFNALLPLQEDELQLSPAAAPASPAPAERSAPTAPEPVQPAAPMPALATPAPVSATPASAAPVLASAVETKPVAAPLEQPQMVAEEASAVVPLYQKLKASQPAGQTLSETLRPERAINTLAEQAPKVETLREAISINQRFSFINELFGGENMEYHAAIQHLDTLLNAEAAKRYVSEHLASKYDWTRKDEHVNKLIKLIDRKFA